MDVVPVFAGVAESASPVLRWTRRWNASDLLRTLGKLKFRTSGAQNLLQHSIEVGWLAGAMAAELGQNVKQARRAGEEGAMPSP